MQQPVDKATVILWARKECADRGIDVRSLSDDELVDGGSGQAMPWHVRQVLAIYRQPIA